MGDGLAILKIGPLKIYLYGVILTLAILLGIFIARDRAQKHGEDKNLVWEIFPVSFVFGLIGARFYHVVHFWGFYRDNPTLIPAVWLGGLGIIGAIIGGVFGLWLISKVKKLDFKKWLDISAPSVALGQAIGRWGNFFNQELYGRPTTLPWGLYISPDKRPSPYLSFDFFHPLFLYESLLDFLNFSILIFLFYRFSQRLLKGELFLIYLLNYSLIRFFLEGLRFENWHVFEIPVARLFSLIFIFLALLLFSFRRLFSSFGARL